MKTRFEKKIGAKLINLLEIFHTKKLSSNIITKEVETVRQRIYESKKPSGLNK